MATIASQGPVLTAQTKWPAHRTGRAVADFISVYDGQSDEFVSKLMQLIPLGRMAAADECKSAIAFLVSDASSYITETSLIVARGLTAW